jgi:putative endopeptidase
MRVTQWALVAATVAAIGAPVWAQEATSPANGAMPKLERFDPKQVDKSVDPCTDFFEYACHTWNEANPIPADQAGWGTFNELAIWNLTAIRNTLEEAAKPSADRMPAEQKAGDYYASCMDEAAVNAAGIKPLDPLLNRIARLHDKSQLPQLLAAIHQTIRPADPFSTDAQYRSVLFGFASSPDLDDARRVIAAIDQSGMSMPSRDFYLKNDDKSKEIREKFLKHVARMLVLSGEPQAEAEADAKAVLEMETTLAKSAMDIVARRDPKNLNNKFTLAQLKGLTPSFDWSQYLAAVNAPASREYLVLAPGFLRGMNQLIVSESVEHWRALLRYQAIRMLAPMLSQPFVDESFDFYARTLYGSPQIQPRWRRCSANADIDLGDAVGQAYVKRYFPPESKARMVELVKALEASLHQDIDAATWMSPETKLKAHQKLNAQIDKIGYPDKWNDYSTVTIRRNDFFGNATQANLYEFDRRLSKIGKAADRHEWNMTPPTVNAYEDPQTNTINFPAGILQPPFFDAAAPDAVNYGAIGMVIGHEIIHGFDDQGRKFDADGNLKDWWTDRDASAYEKRGACISEEYTQYVPEAGVEQDGKLSQGEDTADNGGMHIALNALKNKLQDESKTLDSPVGNGLTQGQTFFLAYANVWCGALRPEAAHTLVQTQGHSLNRYRVNNVVSNMPEFEHAFGCKAGQKMVRVNQCRVW